MIEYSLHEKINPFIWTIEIHLFTISNSLHFRSRKKKAFLFDPNCFFLYWSLQCAMFEGDYWKNKGKESSSNSCSTYEDILETFFKISLMIKEIERNSKLKRFISIDRKKKVLLLITTNSTKTKRIIITTTHFHIFNNNYVKIFTCKSIVEIGIRYRFIHYSLFFKMTLRKRSFIQIIENICQSIVNRIDSEKMKLTKRQKEE